jgi:hypothetical protein
MCAQNMYFKKFSSSFKISLIVKSRRYDLSKEQIITELLFFGNIVLGCIVSKVR